MCFITRLNLKLLLQCLLSLCASYSVCFNPQGLLLCLFHSSGPLRVGSGEREEGVKEREGDREGVCVTERGSVCVTDHTDHVCVPHGN